MQQESRHKTGRLRVMLVDDHEVVRRGLRSLIETAADLAFVAEASNAADAVRIAHQASPDVVIMDVRLPDGSGIAAARDIRAQRPATRVLILTSFPDEDAVLAAIMAGASGYLLKEVNSAELLAGIRAVGGGRSLLDPAITNLVLDRVREAGRPTRDQKLAMLTPQETRTLELVTEGLTNLEIGRRMGISDKTVKNYVAAILDKLEVNRRSEAAAYLARHTREAGST